MSTLRRWTSLLWPGLLLLPVLFLSVPRAEAISFSNSNFYQLADGESLEEEAWIMGQLIQLDGEAKDDVFAMSMSNLVSGSMGGDFWSFSETVVQGGEVGDDFRAAGRVVQLQGSVGGDMLAAGETVQTSEGSEIGGQAFLVGSHVLVDGSIQGTTRIMAQRATLAGHFHDTVTVEADEIVVLRDAQFDGDLRYRSGDELFLDKKVQLGGALERLEGDRMGTPQLSSNQFLVWQGILLMAAVLVGLPMVGLFPIFTARSVRLLRFAPWRCLLVGLVVFCLLPMFCTVAMATVVGLPLGLFTGAAFASLLYTSKIVVALALGGLILRRQGTQPFAVVLLGLLVGLLLLYILVLLPIVGAAVWAITAFCGMGAMTISLFAPKTFRQYGDTPGPDDSTTATSPPPNS